MQNKKAHAIVADLQYPSEWDRVVEEAVSRMGALDVLVNNPAPFGFAAPGDIHARSWLNTSIWPVKANGEGLNICLYTCSRSRPSTSCLT